ncbi:MAG: hypothetical protein ABIE22_05145 [archaeon]
MKNKRGMSHIEMISSFLIFVGFLIFLFTFLNPLREAPVNTNLLDLVERGILTEINVEVGELSFRINQSYATCFEFSYDDIRGKVIAKNENGDKVDAESSGSTIRVGGSGEFFRVYMHPDFTESSLAGCSVFEDYVNIGLSKSYRIAYYNNLVELKNDYENDYNSLKNSLNLPAKNDFAFSVRDGDENEMLSSGRTVPKGINVLARDIPVQTLYSDGNLTYLRLNIKVW